MPRPNIKTETALGVRPAPVAPLAVWLPMETQ
jgi:hypothetical protein